jgi:hypothetical protein
MGRDVRTELLDHINRSRCVTNKDPRRRIEESRRLLERSQLAIDSLGVDMAHARKFIAESERLLEITESAIARTTLMLPSSPADTIGKAGFSIRRLPNR